MTEEQKKLIDQYIEKEEIEIPDMAPTKKELENPVPVLKELPMKQEAIPKAVSWEFFWNTGITTIINECLVIHICKDWCSKSVFVCISYLYSVSKIIFNTTTSRKSCYKKCSVFN